VASNAQMAAVTSKPGSAVGSNDGKSSTEGAKQPRTYKEIKQRLQQLQ